MNLSIPISLFCSVILVLIVFGVSSCDKADQETLPKDFFVKFYGEEGNQEGVDLLVNTLDQSLILLGTTYSGEESRLYLMKTDWFGNVIWKKKLGSNDIAKDIEFSNDGGFIILCQSLGINGDIADTKLLKVSAEGVKTDSVVFGLTRVGGSSANEYPEKVTALTDGYIVMGTTDFDSTTVTVLNLFDYLHVKFDESLNIITEFKQWSSHASWDYGVKAVQLSGGNLYALVSSSNPSTGNLGPIDNDLNFWFFGLDDAGEVDDGESGYFGTDAPRVGESLPVTDERLTAVCPTSPPGYFLVGSYSTGSSVSDIFYAQLGEDGSDLRAQGSGRIVIPNRKIAPVAVCQSFREGDLGYLILANEGDAGTSNIWLTKVNDQGGELWSYSFGAQGGNNDTAGAVAELPDGSIIVVGTVNIGDESELKISLFKLNGRGMLAN